jgi:hypothetical protein
MAHGRLAVIVAVTANITMATNYIRELGGELEKRLRHLEGIWRDGDWAAADTARAELIKVVKERVLESYRNGLNAVSLRVDTAAKKLERPVRAS